MSGEDEARTLIGTTDRTRSRFSARRSCGIRLRAYFVVNATVPMSIGSSPETFNSMDVFSGVA